MKIEINLDEIGLKLESPIAFGVVRAMVEDEFKRIAQKHRSAMVVEMNELISKFVVATIRESHNTCTKIVITTPE